MIGESNRIEPCESWTEFLGIMHSPPRNMRNTGLDVYMKVRGWNGKGLHLRDDMYWEKREIFPFFHLVDKKVEGKKLRESFEEV